MRLSIYNINTSNAQWGVDSCDDPTSPQAGDRVIFAKRVEGTVDWSTHLGPNGSFGCLVFNGKVAQASPELITITEA